MNKIEKLDIKTDIKVNEFVNMIKDCHEKLFPDASLLTQCEKFEEEFEEFETTNYNDTKELADLFIVACGIYRFNKAIGECLCTSILSSFYKDDLKLSIFANVVVDKMNKNIDRVWDNKNGYYHNVSSIN